MTARSRNGEAIPTTDEADDDRGDDRQLPAVGGEQAPIRRSETSRACAFSAAVTVPGRASGPCYSDAVSSVVLQAGLHLVGGLVRVHGPGSLGAEALIC